MVPSALLYDKTLQPVVRDTWARLRGLAWGRAETPELSMDELCRLLDMKRSTLYGHLLILKARAALQWRAVGSKTIIVSFPDAADQSRNLDKPNLLSTGELNTKDSETKAKDTPVQKSKNLDKPNVYQMARLLADFSHIQYGANSGRLLGEAKLFVKLDPLPTMELLRQHYNGDKSSFWWTQDWRGKKGDKPTLFAIRETWGQWQPAAVPAKSGELDAVHIELRELLRANNARLKAEREAQNANNII